MKIPKKVITLIMLIIIIFSVAIKNQINIVTCLNLGTDTRKITNVAVLLYSFDDMYMSKLKQDLEDIENANKDKVHYMFYDGKGNIAIQSETLDSLVRSNIDLFIVNLADLKESTVQDVILKVKPLDVPLIIIGYYPESAEKLARLYDKVVFVATDPKEDGISQGKMIADLWNKDKTLLDKNGDNVLSYILLGGEASNQGAIERSKYVISTINDSGIKTEQLAKVNANWSKELAKSSIDSLILSYNGRIEAIISNNDAMAIGAVEALQKYGYNKGDKSKYVSVFGFDGLPEAKDLIDKGYMTGTISSDPKILAEELYVIGRNLINDINPIENTNYQLKNGSIVIPITYQEYIKPYNSEKT